VTTKVVAAGFCLEYNRRVVKKIIIAMSPKIEVISRNDFFKIISRRYSVPIARKIVVLSEGTLTPLKDMRIIYSAVSSIKPGTILEIGTFYGWFTLGLFLNDVYADVYTIDIYKEMRKKVPSCQKRQVLAKNKIGQAFKNKIPFIHQILGDSRNLDTYSILKGKTVDFAFIDGNHSFKAVLRDTRNVLRFARKNSIIFWHDFNNETGVDKALNEILCKDKLEIFHIDKTWLAFSIL
jgi:predicted O-methyltransferase YrrM